jgi:RNA polymerase sigma-70 factor (ECF subfamily)
MKTRVVHTDWAVAKRLRAGDEQAFRELFDGVFPKLYRFALVRLDARSDDAVEAVQQTFCKAFEHIDAYRGEASLYGWMCQICRNVIADDGRRKQREGARNALLEDDVAIESVLESLSAPEADEPEKYAARGELARLIQATLDRLPDRYGDVLEWKYVDGLSVKEIARQLAIGPKAAESLLTRARTAFRDTVVALDAAADLSSNGH